MKHVVKRKIDLPQGGSVTVTVSSDAPISEDDFMILRPQAAVQMANCLIDLGEALKSSKP